ncbi:UNVERIFIED_CONTAM: hypothetical protein FKN15_033984 [Acipenser sinensis]
MNHVSVTPEENLVVIQTTLEHRPHWSTDHTGAQTTLTTTREQRHTGAQTTLEHRPHWSTDHTHHNTRAQTTLEHRHTGVQTHWNTDHTGYRPHWSTDTLEYRPHWSTDHTGAQTTLTTTREHRHTGAQTTLEHRPHSPQHESTDTLTTTQGRDGFECIPNVTCWVCLRDGWLTFICFKGLLYFGCGLVVPESLEGCKVLDLGSGSGRDCYILSKLVGQTGHVTGVDMTSEMILTSRNYLQYHQEKFGYEKANTDFVQGYLESLGEAGIQSDCCDVLM